MSSLPDAAVNLQPIGELTGPAEDRCDGDSGAFASDRLGFLLQARAEFGPLVRFDGDTTIVNDPQLAVAILVDRNQSYADPGILGVEQRSAETLAHLWRLRSALTPGARRARAGMVASSVVSLWREELHAVSGGSVNPSPLLDRVAAMSFTQLFFGEDAEIVKDGVCDLLSSLDANSRHPFSMSASRPPSGREVQEGYRELGLDVAPLLRQRAHRPDARDQDLATAIIGTLSADPGGPLPEGVVQMVIDSLLAAQRGPAAAAAWMLWEVAQDLALQERLRSEASRYAGMISSGATPNASGYPHAMAVVLETLRLHPPVWLVRRRLLRDESLGGYRVPQGHNIWISPYVLHRDETRFEQASSFLVERWPTGLSTQSSFMPFGRGVRGCPGSEVAVAVLVALLLTTLSTHQMTATDGVVVADPGLTLVPSGLELTFTRRGTSDGGS
jgi:cytochrome P450